MIIKKLISNTKKYFSTSINPVDLVSTEITVLTLNDLKFIFYPSWYGLTCIDPIDTVLTENDGFEPKWPKTHFLLWLTVWPILASGIDFHRKWQFWPEMAWNLFFVLVDTIWLVLTHWTCYFMEKKAVDLRKIYFWILNCFLNFLFF